ncbi:MAG: hypothetical protein KAT05_12440, partial [Spirochaetes bacterium]|nr:hypothetical protein [Spirochaetota bacterium]
MDSFAYAVFDIFKRCISIKNPTSLFTARRHTHVPDSAEKFALLRLMVANESETEIKIIFLNHSKNHRGH